MRTSAVAGLQAKYCAPSDTDTATLIGAGVIGRTMIMAICEAIPTVKTIYLCDLDLEKAEQVAKESEGKYGVTIIPTSDSKAAAAKSQLIVGETTARTPFIDKSWVKPHSAIVCVSNEATTDVVKAADVNVVDYWKQIITFKNKAITQVFDAGEITKEEVLETSDLVLMDGVALVGDAAALKNDLALRGGLQQVQASDEGGLSGTGGPDDHHDLPLSDGGVDALEYLQIAEILFQSLDLKQNVVSGHCTSSSSQKDPAPSPARCSGSGK